MFQRLIQYSNYRDLIGIRENFEILRRCVTDILEITFLAE